MRPKGFNNRENDFTQLAIDGVSFNIVKSAINIGFKGTLLLDILNNLDSAEITCLLADPSRAGIIMPAEQREGEEVLMLLMPMMLND